MPVTVVMLVGLPAAGIVASGRPLDLYLEFPPRTRYVEHEPFSWGVFAALGLFLALVLGPLLVRALKSMRLRDSGSLPPRRSLPWWGWAGAALAAVSWVFAWSDTLSLAWLQGWTFTPLWVGYILVVNALAFRRSGRSPLTDRTRSYLLLFPSSAAFWWFFEYLNRFVQNWYYAGSDLDSWSYFWSATLPFSTVLPAVLGTKALIETFSLPERGFKDFIAIRAPAPRALSWFCLIVAGAGLAAIGVWPNYTYPLLWVSPLIILVALDGAASRPHILSPVTNGDWREIVTASSAALVCGFFWEMWNIYSYPKWIYSIPYVHGFQLFEMPLLGYAGYLPFGLECVVVADLLVGWREPYSPNQAGAHP